MRAGKRGEIESLLTFLQFVQCASLVSCLNVFRELPNVPQAMPRHKGTGKRDKAGTGNNKGVKAIRCIGAYRQAKEEPPDERQGPKSSSDEGDGDEDTEQRRRWSSYLRKTPRQEAREARAAPPELNLSYDQVCRLSEPGPTLKTWVSRCSDADLRAALAVVHDELASSPALNDLCSCAPRSPLPSFLCRGWRCYAFEVGGCGRPSDWQGHEDCRAGCGKNCMGWDYCERLPSLRDLSLQKVCEHGSEGSCFRFKCEAGMFGEAPGYMDARKFNRRALERDYLKKRQRVRKQAMWLECGEEWPVDLDQTWAHKVDCLRCSSESPECRLCGSTYTPQARMIAGW